MHRTSKLLCVFMCITLLFVSVFVPPAFAATQGRITGDGVRLRSEANKDNNNNIITSFSKGTIVQINGTVKDAAENTWYEVTYAGKPGYVYGMYVEEIAETYDPIFENNLKNFPESYHAALRAIHNAYPNWVFKADKVNMSLDAAINLEYSATDVTKTRKYVELKYGLEWRDSRAGDAQPESGWTYASRQAIAFFMDPRNALTVSPEKSSFPSIFTFMLQTYDPQTQTVEGLRKVVGTSFLAKGYDTNGDSIIEPDAYINDIMSAAEQSGVSPYVIASKIITEKGHTPTNNLDLISGTYPGYEGYYNFFNYGAYPTETNSTLINGLEYAKKAGWNSRRASIIGGAKEYGSGYVGTGQDTFYYMDFNVHGNCSHQFATSVYDQCVKASNAKKVYISDTLSFLTFKIPVYSSLPEGVYTAPTMADYSAQTGTQPSGGGSTRRKGDYDGDGQVTVKELALIRMHLLGVKPLSATECSYLDVTGEGELTVKDLATVRMYLLGLVSI